MAVTVRGSRAARPQLVPAVEPKPRAGGSTAAKGLLPTAGRTAIDHCLYTEHGAELLTFIRRARGGLGLHLDNISGVLARRRRRAPAHHGP